MSADPGDLANLADLALPPPVSFWPPAIGVWIVAATALAALMVICWRALRRYRTEAYLREAIAELRALSLAPNPDEPGTTEAVSAILKRVAIVRYGRGTVASLTGAGWAAFITRTAPQGAKTDAIAAQLVRFAASESPATPLDQHSLFAQARIWLRGQRGHTATEA